MQAVTVGGDYLPYLVARGHPVTVCDIYLAKPDSAGNLSLVKVSRGTNSL